MSKNVERFFLIYFKKYDKFNISSYEKNSILNKFIPNIRTQIFIFKKLFASKLILPKNSITHYDLKSIKIILS